MLEHVRARRLAGVLDSATAMHLVGLAGQRVRVGEHDELAIGVDAFAAVEARGVDEREFATMRTIEPDGWRQRPSSASVANQSPGAVSFWKFGVLVDMGFSEPTRPGVAAPGRLLLHHRRAPRVLS